MSNIRPARDVFIGNAPGTPDAGGRVPGPAGPFAVQPGEGSALETPTGDTVLIKATTAQTNGSLTVLELLIGPKQGPALRTHLREDVLWYVIEGDFRFKAGDAMRRRRPVVWRSGRAARRTASRTSVIPLDGSTPASRGSDHRCHD